MAEKHYVARYVCPHCHSGWIEESAWRPEPGTVTTCPRCHEPSVVGDVREREGLIGEQDGDGADVTHAVWSPSASDRKFLRSLRISAE